jgi:hypothetical protein
LNENLRSFAGFKSYPVRTTISGMPVAIH